MDGGGDVEGGLRARRAAGVREELHLYDARGSAATRLVLAGASPAELAVYMGWSPQTAADMIERYASLDPAISDAVLTKLARFEEKARTDSAK